MYRNKLNYLSRKVEREHYDCLLKENKNNLRNTWKILKSIINSKKSSTLPAHFNVNGQKGTDKKMIANSFNNYFIQVGPNLAKDIPASIIEPTSFLPNRIVNSLFLKPVIKEEIATIVKSLKNASPGWDLISTNIVKATINSFIVPLTHVLNLSITMGVFPNEMKIAKVLPLFKNSNSMILTNYRPISVLPLFSKFWRI